MALKLRNSIIVANVAGGIFVVLLAAGLAIQWSALLEKYPTVHNVEEIDTSGWTKYEGEINGFPIAFLYPEKWQLIKHEDPKAGISLKSPSFKQPVSNSGRQLPYFGDISITAQANPGDVDLLLAADRSTDASRFWPRKYSFRDEVINGHPAIVYDGFTEGEDLPFRQLALLGADHYTMTISRVYSSPEFSRSTTFNMILNSVVGEPKVDRTYQTNTSLWLDREVMSGGQTISFRMPTGWRLQNLQNENDNWSLTSPVYHPLYNGGLESFSSNILPKDQSGNYINSGEFYILLIEKETGQDFKEVLRASRTTSDKFIQDLQLEDIELGNARSFKSNTMNVAPGSPSWKFLAIEFEETVAIVIHRFWKSDFDLEQIHLNIAKSFRSN